MTSWHNNVFTYSYRFYYAKSVEVALCLKDAV